MSTNGQQDRTVADGDAGGSKQPELSQSRSERIASISGLPPRSLLPTTDADDGERLKTLLAWALTRSIWIHDAVSIGSMPRSEAMQGETQDKDEDGNSPGPLARGDGFGIYVKPGHMLLPRQVVVLVPKMAMFSGRTASLARYLQPQQLFDADASAGLLLTTCLLYEYLLGPPGPWWGYLQSMPRQRPVGHGEGAGQDDRQIWGIQLPLNIDKQSEAWKWLRRTECGRMVRRAESDRYVLLEGIGMSSTRMQHYFRSTAMPLILKAMPGRRLEAAQLWLDFVAVQSIVSSRSFVVDMYHGLVLVPVADMFNHEDDPNIHFEADDEVCDECGALGACPHTDDPLPASSYGRPSAFLPAESGPNSVEWKPPAALQGVDTVDLVAQEHVFEYDEAYNNYGNLSNSILLATYGFCLPEATRWERYGWEWRFDEERDEILQAFGLSPSSQTNAGRKRPFEDEQTGEIESVTSANTILIAWAKQCAAWTLRPSTDFLEVCGDPITVLRNAHTEGGPPTNSLPVASPWALLSNNEEDGADSQGEDSSSDSQAPGTASTSAIFAPLSGHDGSRDRYQPLFIDVCGRVSLPLWRAALLLAITEACRGSPSSDNEFGSSVANIEIVLEQMANTCLSEGDGRKGTASDISLSASDRAAARIAVVKLKTLMDTRLMSLEFNEESSALSSPPQPSLLHSAIVHAHQERDALTLCSEMLKRLQSRLESIGSSP